MSSGELPRLGGGVMTPIDPPSGGRHEIPARPLEPQGAQAPISPPQPQPPADPLFGQPIGLLCPRCGQPQLRQQGGDACQTGCGPIPGVDPNAVRPQAPPGPPQPQPAPAPQPTQQPAMGPVVDFDPSVFAPPPRSPHAAPPQQGPVGMPHPLASGPVEDPHHARAQFEAGLAGGAGVVEPPRQHTPSYEESRAAFEGGSQSVPAPTPSAESPPRIAEPMPPPPSTQQPVQHTAQESVMTVQVTLRGGWTRIQGAIEALQKMGVLG